MENAKTVFGNFCYVVQGTCKYVRCEMCMELKEPDKDEN